MNTCGHLIKSFNITRFTPELKRPSTALRNYMESLCVMLASHSTIKINIPFIFYVAFFYFLLCNIDHNVRNPKSLLKRVVSIK